MNCAVVKGLSILLSAMHKTSRFSFMIFLRLSNLYLIEFIFKYEKKSYYKDSDFEEILNHLVQF